MSYTWRRKKSCDLVGVDEVVGVRLADLDGRFGYREVSDIH